MNTTNTTFMSSGDLGDVTYSLATCRKLNDPGSEYYLVNRPWTKQWNDARVNALVPLMERQPYIGKVIYGEPTVKITHDFSTFRSGGLPYGKSLCRNHSDWVGVDLGPYEPWLFANSDRRAEGKVLIHRSPRYHNPVFPWRELAKAFGDRMMAVGVPVEHADLETALGIEVPLVETMSYLELAELISGCDLFIGNQSSPMSIALGLGVPVVQEVSIRQPDCIFPEANAFYVHDGWVSIDDKLYGFESRLLKASVQPPGGWITDVAGSITGSNLEQAACRIAKWHNCSYKEAEAIVIRENTIRVRRDYPTFQPTRGQKVEPFLTGCPPTVRTRMVDTKRVGG